MTRLRLLGSPKVEGAAAAVAETVSRRHPVALLAVLAAAPSASMQRSKAAGLLWPESTEERARHRLNSCVYRVRQSLGEEAVLTRGDALELNGDVVASDLAAFEAALDCGNLERAVELYGGPFLDGFHLPGSVEFEHWVDRVRSRIEERHRNALGELAEAAEQRGDLGAATRWWRERARQDPYDGQVAARLMRVLAASGNRAEALRVAEDHARRLEEELGAEPNEELAALARAIRAGGTAATRAGDPSSTRMPPVRSASGGARAERPPAPPSAATRDVEGAGAGARPSRGPRVRTVLLLVAATGLAAFGVWRLRTGPAGSASERGAGTTAPTSIAVLPFDTLGTADANPFAAGLQEDLLTRLAGVSGLRVISATSVARYRSSDLSLRGIADSLAVDWVIEGGVQRSGDRIRVYAQLIDPRSDAHVWARQYERALTAENLFRIQADISTAIADAVQARLSLTERERLRRPLTGDLDAYRWYAEGRRLLNQRTPSKMQRAALLFHRALERDSAFALAWAGLADAEGVIRSWGYEPPAGLPDRDTAARMALELDPGLAEAHTAVAGIAIRDRDLPAAIEHLERAVELRPSYTQARTWLTSAYFHAGRLDAALATMETTRALDRQGFFTNYGGAQLYLATGRYEEALELIQRAAEPDVTYPVADLEAWTLYHLGRLQDAEMMLADAEDPANRAVLALVRTGQGDRAAARRILGELEGEPDAWFWVGLVRAGLDDVDRAFAAFDRVEGWGHLTDVALRYWFPGVLGAVRADPRYGELVARVRRYYGLDASPSSG